MSGTRWIVAGLVALNAVLGVAVYQKLPDRLALAQGGGEDVVTVSGYAGGTSVLYMYDAIGGVMVVLRADPVNKRVDVVTQRDVGGDFARLK